MKNLVKIRSKTFDQRLLYHDRKSYLENNTWIKMNYFNSDVVTMAKVTLKGCGASDPNNMCAETQKLVTYRLASPAI